MQTSVFSITQNQYGNACQQQDMAGQIRNALIQTTNNDNKTRTEAEKFMIGIVGQNGVLQSLLEIVTSQDVSEFFVKPLAEQARRSPGSGRPIPQESCV